jgi:proteasome accessory factor A
VQFRDFTLDNPIRAIREISHDLTGRRTVRLAGGREASALDIQREYHARAVEHVAARGSADPTIERVLELWGRTLDAVEQQNLSLIDREIDWAIKHRLLDRYQQRKDLDLASPRIAQLDLAYHDIRRGRGLFDLLQRKGMVERVTDDGEIEAAKDTPPQTTRAKLRGRSAPCSARTRSGRSTSGWTG